MPALRSRATGGPFEGVSLVHAGVPPVPLACDSTQTSLVSPPEPVPPNMVMVFKLGSYVAPCPLRPEDGVPEGLSCVQVGVPFTPLALERTQKALNMSTPKTIMPLVFR